MEFQRWIDNMRTRTALVLFFGSVLVGGMLVFAWGASAASKTVQVKPDGKAQELGKVEWRDFGSALEEAEADKKILLIDIYTDWCGWCKRMEATTYTDENVQSYIREAFVPVKLNAESNQRAVYLGEEYTYRQIAGSFGVRGYPTTMFLDHDGSRITAVPGFMNAQQFLTVLRYIGGRVYEKNKSFEEFRAETEAEAAKTP